MKCGLACVAFAGAMVAIVPLHAQTVGGIVRDRMTNEAIEHVTILLRDTADSTVAIARSDALGMFYLAAPRPGRYTVRLSFASGAEQVGPTIVLETTDAFHQAEYAIDVQRGSPFLAHQVDSVSAPLGVVTPRYPMDLLDRSIAGESVVQYVVDADGRVERDGIREVSSTHREFIAAITAALPRVRHRPALLAGRAVRQLVQERYVFTFVNRTPTIRIDRESVVRLPD